MFDKTKKVAMAIADNKVTRYFIVDFTGPARTLKKSFERPKKVFKEYNETFDFDDFKEENRNVTINILRDNLDHLWVYMNASLITARTSVFAMLILAIGMVVNIENALQFFVSLIAIPMMFVCFYMVCYKKAWVISEKIRRKKDENITLQDFDGFLKKNGLFKCLFFPQIRAIQADLDTTKVKKARYLKNLKNKPKTA